MDKISELKKIIIQTLDINKALDIVSIDLKNKSSMADYMIIASGTSSRHIQSLSEQVLDRIKFCKKLIGKNKSIEVQFYEDRIKSNKTFDLINYLTNKQKYDIYFIMGADNLINFHKWYKWKSILQKCNILVFDRHGYKKKSLNSMTFKRLKSNLKFIEFNKVNISSSQLRKI